MEIRGDQLERGSVIGGYRIDEAISRGGMGVVYRVTNIALRKIYALKVLAPELSDDLHFRERFKREMRTAASLHHPNVVGIHYAGEHEGLLFLVMDYVYGTDLRQILLETGGLEPDRAVDLLVQFASALDAAHAKGLVHRDVKPANMLVTVRDGEEHGYLTDFGLAKRADNVGGMTSTGVMVGTVDYMAPEQISGDRTDARTDVYALGCVFFHMLTGSVPYDRDNSIATLFAHVHEPPPPLSEALMELHPPFGEVIEKAMAKAPEGRYLSAGDFARDAAAALSGIRYTGPATVVGTGDARPAAAGETVVETAETTPDSASPATPETVKAPEPAPPAPGETVETTPEPASPAPQETSTSARTEPAAAPGGESEISPPDDAGQRGEPAVTAGAQETRPDTAPAMPAPTAPPSTERVAAAAPSSTERAAAAPPSSTERAAAAAPPASSPPGRGKNGPAGGGSARRRWPLLAGLVAAIAIAAVVIVLVSGGSSTKVSGQGFAATVRPVPTNRVTATGSATIQLSGSVATVTVNTNGLLNAVHLMHIHGGTGNCPPASAAQTFNGHKFIGANVGDQFYGGVVTSLTLHGSTSPAVHLNSSLYPTAGNIRYKRTLTLASGIAAEIREGLAVIVVHGISYDGKSSYDNFLGSGAEAGAPALCGALFPAQSVNAGIPSAPATVYTASLAPLASSGTTRSSGVELLCHIGGLTVSVPAGAGQSQARAPT